MRSGTLANLRTTILLFREFARVVQVEAADKEGINSRALQVLAAVLLTRPAKRWAGAEVLDHPNLTPVSIKESEHYVEALCNCW